MNLLAEYCMEPVTDFRQLYIIILLDCPKVLFSYLSRFEQCLQFLFRR